LSLFVQGDMGRIVQAYQRIFSVATVLISAVMSWLVESGAEILGGLARYMSMTEVGARTPILLSF